MVERRESVRVTAEGGDFSREFAKLSAEAIALREAIKGIPNRVSVKADTRGLDQLDQRARRAERSSSALVDSAVALWPALLPISALAVPAIAGLATQFGFAAAGAGSMILAFHGVGDALKALDTYQLEPTAANLAKVNEQMSKLGPSGQDFVRELDRIEPQLKSLKVAAENGIFPGATEGLDHLLVLLPQVRRIIGEVSGATGGLLADAGKNLAGPEFKDFFNYLETQAKPILIDLGKTTGNFAAGLAHLFVGFGPSEREFSSFMLSVSRGFDSWASGLSKTEGFQHFLDYLHDTGPDVAHALGSIGNALVSVAQAGAPLGGPILHALGDLADIIDRIARSPIGTPLVALASGLALVNRAMAISAGMKGSLVAELVSGRSPGISRTRTQLTGLKSDLLAVRRNAAMPQTIFSVGKDGAAERISAVSRETDRLKTNLRGVGKGAAGLAAVGLEASGAADGLGLTQTASLALAGTFIAPGWGTAIGAGAGALLDVKSAGAGVAQTLKDVHQAAAQGDYDRLSASVKRLAAQNKDLNNITGVGDAASDAAKKLGSLFGGNNIMNDSGELFAAKVQLGLLGIIKDAPAAKTKMDLLGSGFRLTSQGAQAAGESVAAFTGRLQALNEVLTGRASLRSYQAALDDVRASLKQNGKTLDINTAKGRNNQAALDNIASTAIAYANTLKRADAIKFLDGSRRGLAAAAQAFGLTRKQAQALANKLLDLGLIKATPHIKLQVGNTFAQLGAVAGALAGLGKKVAMPKIRVDVGASYGAIAGVAAGLDRLNGKTAVTYTVTRQKKALGGPIYGVGGPRQDNIPIMASAGEFMVNARAYSKYAREIEWINAQGLANGGRVGMPASVNVGSPNVNVPLRVFVNMGELGGVVEVKANAVYDDRADMATMAAGARR